MGKKLIVIALAAVGFASAPRTNAGTEVVEPQYAPQQTYNYAPPPPRPVYYPYPVPVSVVAYPTVAFYPRPFFGFRRAVFVRPFPRHIHHWR
jgi:hypothetical protein